MKAYLRHSGLKIYIAATRQIYAWLSGLICKSSIIYLALFTSACQASENSSCRNADYSGADYTICSFDPKAVDIRLFLKGGNDQVLGSFDAVNSELKKTKEMLVFAMNGGMYHKDRSPVGFYREVGASLGRLQTKASSGNFGMLPNGVFYLHNGRAGVTETSQFLLKSTVPDYATQSGPMLVIDGALHPNFNEGSTSRRIRNGVGVTDAGEVVFIMSEQPVNFHDFASLFKDEMKTSNALYLDGVISRLFSRELDRNDFGSKMGPIIGVVAPINAP